MLETHRINLLRFSGDHSDEKRIYKTVSVGRCGRCDCAAYRYFLSRVGSGIRLVGHAILKDHEGESYFGADHDNQRIGGVLKIASDNHMQVVQRRQNPIYSDRQGLAI